MSEIRQKVASHRFLYFEKYNNDICSAPEAMYIVILSCLILNYYSLKFRIHLMDFNKCMYNIIVDAYKLLEGNL